MKKIKISLILFSAMLIFASGMLLTSCQKEDELTPNNLEKSSEVLTHDVEMPKVKNGILVFDTKSSAEDYLRNFASNTSTYQEFEKNVGFKSVQTLYWEILDSQSNLYDEFDAIYQANKSDLSKLESLNFEKNSEITKKYLNSGLIKEETVETESGKIEVLSLTTSAPYYAPILNLENLVVINDTIYQFNQGEIRMITDGDFSKIEQMKKLDDSNLDENIIVGTSTSKSTTYYHDIGYSRQKFGADNGYNYGSHRIFAQLRSTIHEYTTSQGLWRYLNYYVDLRSYRMLRDFMPPWKLLWYSKNYKINFNGSVYQYHTYHNWTSSTALTFSDANVTTSINYILHETWQRASDFTYIEYKNASFSCYLRDYPNAEINGLYHDDPDFQVPLVPHN